MASLPVDSRLLPRLKIDNWTFDAVSLLAFIGESSVAKQSQAMTASVLCLLPRIIPAPQALLRPSRPRLLANVPAKLTGIDENTETFDSVGLVAAMITPLNDVVPYSFKVVQIDHTSDHSAPDLVHQSGSLVGPSYLHTIDNSDRQPAFKQASSTSRLCPSGSENAINDSPTTPVRTKLLSPIHLLSIFSCLLSIALIVCAFVWRDGPAVLAVSAMSLASAILGYASVWVLKPSKPPRTSSHERTTGDVLIRTKEGAFILVKCSPKVARELYSGDDAYSYVVSDRTYRLLTALGTTLIMLGVVFFGNSGWNFQLLVGSSYLVLNLFYYWIGMLPASSNWDLSRYRWKEVTPEDAECTHEPQDNDPNARPSFTRSLWFAIRDTGRADWVKRNGAIPETPQWEQWLREAEENALVQNRKWPAVRRMHEIVGTSSKEGIQEMPADGKLLGAPVNLRRQGDVLKQVEQPEYQEPRIRKFVNKIRSFTRPGPPSGYERITWRSAYGKPMHIDVKEAFDGGAQLLQTRFRQSAVAIGKTSSTSPTSSSSAPSQPQRPAQAHISANPRYEPLLPNNGGIRPNSDDSATTENPATTLDQEEQHRRYLLLCFSTSKSKTFRQIDVTDLTNDQYVFRRIQEVYREIRSTESWVSSLRTKFRWFPWFPSCIAWWLGDLSFFTPQRADFISFTLMPVREDVRPYGIEQSLPPEIEVQKQNWHYHPCPRLINHFRMDDAFVTLMLEPGHAYIDDAWLDLFPKKLRTEFAYRHRNTGLGWGIHVVEGLNPLAVAWVGLSISLASGVIGAVASMLAKDAGVGFTIAAWIAGTAVLAVTYLQLREQKISADS